MLPKKPKKRADRDRKKYRGVFYKEGKALTKIVTVTKLDTGIKIGVGRETLFLPIHKAELLSHELQRMVREIRAGEKYLTLDRV